MRLLALFLPALALLSALSLAGCGDGVLEEAGEASQGEEAGASGQAGAAGKSGGASAAGWAGAAGKAGSAGGGGAGGASGSSGQGGAGGQAGEAGAGGQAGEAGAGGQAGAAGGAGAGPEAIPGPTVRVATFNLRTSNADKGTPNAWDNRKKLLFQVFKELDADFIGVQEALIGQLKEIDAAAPAYDRIGEGRDGGTKGEFSAIYYRKSRFQVQDQETFWLSTTPDKVSAVSFDDKYPRIVTWGRFREKSSGYQLYHYNTHFGLTATSARESALLLVKRIDGRKTEHPFFVTGDLNTLEDQAPVIFLKGKGKLEGQDNPVPMVDTFRVLHPDEPDARTAHGFTGAVKGMKIDYVLAGFKKPDVKSAQIVHTHEGALYPSDHYPVYGSVKMPDQ